VSIGGSCKVVSGWKSSLSKIFRAAGLTMILVVGYGKYRDVSLGGIIF
jgi:hypothetical protein